jgi:ATP-dependent helicase/nuclease subunit B
LASLTVERYRSWRDSPEYDAVAVGVHLLRAAPRAADRQRIAAEWLATSGSSEPALVVAPSLEAGSRVVRRAAEGRPAAFGWQRATLGELAARLAAGRLAALGRTQVAAVVLEAVCARMVHRLRDEGALGRYAAVWDRPGLPRALARTFGELALAGIDRGVPADLERLYAAYRRELSEAGLADRAEVLRAAIERCADPAPHPLLDLPTVWIDVPLSSALDGELVRALAARTEVRAVVPAADATALRRLSEALGVSAEAFAEPSHAGALDRLQRQLFADVREAAPIDASVELFSAPGESRECVEIARRVLRAAQAGVPFDRIAVLSHAPETYRVHLVEALRRARIPAHFSRGTVRPDPHGRALLALLACKAEGLSARAFAEYLSLGVVPDPGQQETGWIPPEDELVPTPEDDEPEPELEEEGPVDADAPIVRGTLRAPWRWERLIVDAVVIGGADRWRRRLALLEQRFAAERAAIEDPDDPAAKSLERKERDLSHLGAFAIPLLELLDALPSRATWGAWASALEQLALRALRDPSRVLAVLRELGPMGPIGPVGLTEVELVLSRRLTEMVALPKGSPAGKLFVASTTEARGLSFDLVFVTGLAERVFPRKIVEDPILLDAARSGFPELATAKTRVAEERLALALAVGAAERGLVLSYPRLDTERGRPRVPSFYGLEILRAIEGTLPSFEELASRAESAGSARMAWPAPERAGDAIDAAEYDLAVLHELLHERSFEEARGAARYLTDANPHLARALRARYARWQTQWMRVDGLVNPSPEAKAALEKHQPSERAFSATALEQLAACPYRFYLRSIVGLEPSERPVAIEALDPRQRGSLIAAAQAEVLAMLRAEGLLPLEPSRLPRARELLSSAVATVERRSRELLAPAVERVWRDAIEELTADLGEWLARMAARPEWRPAAFELAFGIRKDEGHDPASVREPVRLSEGILLRGAIDLVEENGDTLRATDHKSGAAGPSVRTIAGGRVLQPVLYARALEAMFPQKKVAGGRLYYCTTRGGFEERTVALDDESRESVALLAQTLAHYAGEGFFPAAPSDGECARCDYRVVCGPAEERRVRNKAPQRLGQLKKLRKRP